MANRIVISKENNIHFNLALEANLIENSSDRILFLWQNDKCVVIGRNQNPWAECNLDKMKEDSVLLARRMSGGGAVYHDLGNVCFTFISNQGESTKEKNSLIVCSALRKLGIEAELSGRNDIIYKDKKISGSAFQNTKTRFSHHGTMLLNVDMSRLSEYLTPSDEKLTSHGVKSVTSRVCNLGITPQDFMKAMEQAFCESLNEMIETEFVDAGHKVNKLDLFSSDEWNYGKTPSFTDRYTIKNEEGSFDVFIAVKNGIVEDAQIYSDTLNVQMCDEIKKKLIGKTYQKSSVSSEASSS